MFKKFLLALAVIIPSCAFAQGKFATVDTDAIFELMPERATAQTQLEAASKTYEDELTKLREEMDKKVQEYQALAEDTPTSIKERRMQEINEMDNRFQQFYQQAQQNLQREQQQLMAPIQQKILDAIKAVGEAQKFTFIFPEGVALYQGTDVIDATPLVKTQLGL